LLRRGGVYGENDSFDDLAGAKLYLAGDTCRVWGAFVASHLNYRFHPSDGSAGVDLSLLEAGIIGDVTRRVESADLAVLGPDLHGRPRRAVSALRAGAAGGIRGSPKPGEPGVLPPVHQVDGRWRPKRCAILRAKGQNGVDTIQGESCDGGPGQWTAATCVIH
jgi:hypothetical protein